MDDYSNIQRVVIRRPVSIRELAKAMELISRAKLEIDAMATASKYGIVPESIFQYKIKQVDMFISEAVRLSGFANSDDMKYFAENFQKM